MVVQSPFYSFEFWELCMHSDQFFVVVTNGLKPKSQLEKVYQNECSYRHDSKAKMQRKWEATNKP